VTNNFYLDLWKGIQYPFAVVMEAGNNPSQSKTVSTNHSLTNKPVSIKLFY